MKFLISLSLFACLLTSVLSIDVRLDGALSNPQSLLSTYRKYGSDVCSISSPISQSAVDISSAKFIIDTADAPLTGDDKIYLTASYVSIMHYQRGHCHIRDIANEYDSDASPSEYVINLDANDQIALITVQYGIIKTNKANDKFIGDINTKYFLVSPLSEESLITLWSKDYAIEPENDLDKTMTLDQKAAESYSFKDLLDAGDYTTIGYLYLACLTPLLLAAIIRIVRHFTIAGMTKKYGGRSIIRTARSIGYEPQSLNLKIKSLPIFKSSKKFYKKVPSKLPKSVKMDSVSAPTAASPKPVEAGERA